MKTRPPILENFDALRLALETESFSLIRPAGWNQSDSDLEVGSASSIKSEIIKHKCRNKEFYKKNCYEWMVKLDNYQNPLEAMYQLWVVRMLADTPKGNHSQKRFDNIAVRFLPSAVASAESVFNNGYRYIVISTAFVGLIKSYVWLQYSLFKIGENQPRDSNVVCTSILGGAEIEIALRSRNPQVLEIVGKFIGIAIRYLEFRTPSLPPVRLLDLLMDRETGFVKFARTITAVEAFLIYHELAHLLEHDFSKQERTTEEEIDADHIALSMLINHTATNRTGVDNYFIGPIAGIQLFRLMEMVRRTMDFLEENGKIEKTSKEYDVYKKGAIKNEAELSDRLRGIKTSMAYYGLLEAAGSIFDNLSAETYLPIIACQGYMLGQLDDSDPFKHYETLLQSLR